MSILFFILLTCAGKSGNKMMDPKLCPLEDNPCGFFQALTTAAKAA
jgi:hypothetical protein